MIIDFHTHIVPAEIIENRESLARDDHCVGSLFSDPKAKMATVEDLIESMNRDGIDVSVATNMGWSSPDLIRKTNDYIAEAIAKYPDRLVGFCMVHPNWEEAPVEIERCAKAGILGVGELMPHLQQFDLADRDLMAPIVETAQKYGMIILTHASEPVGHVYPGKGDVMPDVLYRFITNFPDAHIVCAHWGGGLPFYALMPEVAEALRNVYFDTAASPFLYRYDIFSCVTDILGAEKILFGSDYPLITQARIIKKLEEVDIPQKAKKLILGKNAEQLLGFC